MEDLFFLEGFSTVFVLTIIICNSDSAVGIIFSSTDTVCTLQVGWICNYSLCFNWRPAALSVGCSMILYISTYVGSPSR